MPSAVGSSSLTITQAMTLNLNYLVVDSIMSLRGTAMIKADVERAPRCRNRAEQARAAAQETTSRPFRENLLTLAAEFDSYAEDIERAGKSFWPRRSGWELIR
jgi:hypothetical protein